MRYGTLHMLREKSGVGAEDSRWLHPVPSSSLILVLTPCPGLGRTGAGADSTGLLLVFAERIASVLVVLKCQWLAHGGVLQGWQLALLSN
jgi:hypothetical protein